MLINIAFLLLLLGTQEDCISAFLQLSRGKSQRSG